MPDEEEEQFFAMFPPEVAEQLRNQHATHDMTLQAERHKAFQTMESFNQEQLEFMRNLMQNFNQYNGEPHALFALIGWYQGFFQGELQRRFNECPACKKDHHEELLKDAREG